MSLAPNKQDAKVLLLAVGGTVLFLRILYVAVLAPATDEAAALERRLPEIRDRLGEGRRLLERSAELRRAVRDPAGEIPRIREKVLPPVSGRYLWAVSTLSRVARGLGLDPLVREHPDERFLPVGNPLNLDPDSIPMWATYAVEVDLLAGYADLKAFLGRLREEVPYGSVASMRITDRPTTPETHGVHLIVEWPVPRFETELDRLRKLADPREPTR